MANQFSTSGLFIIVVDYVSGSSLLWDSSGSLYSVFGHRSQPVLFVWIGWVACMVVDVLIFFNSSLFRGGSISTRYITM